MPAKDAPHAETYAELTVERFVVRSNRDDEAVIGPVESRRLADSECDRLNREQMREHITTGAPGADVIEPPGYRVESIDVRDDAAHRAYLEGELARVAKEEKREPGEHLTELRKQIEAELDA